VELLGSGYLYTIATLAITYAGFAAFIVIFRQIIGGGVSGYNVFVIRSVLMRSFIVAFSAMLPPALAFFDLSQSVIWRISSFVCALLLGLFTLTFQAATKQVRAGNQPQDPKALGLTVPPSMLAAADEVIE